MEAKRWHDRGAGRKPLPDLLRRQAATQATFDKFRRKGFDWAKGNTCAHLARFHARKMGRRVPAMPPFRSALGAKKALAGLGFESMADLLASLFEGIAPAEMLPGDLAVFPGDQGLDAVMVCGGNKLFGWWGDHDKMSLLDLVDAWGSPIPDGFDAPPEMVGRTLGELVRAFRL